jgi:hypothetical protein
MSDRWVTVLAAVLGLLGGIAGAAVGGYVANQGEEQRFEDEREAEIRDLRIDTYVGFLGAVEREHINYRTEDSAMLTAESEVALVAPNAAVREAASALIESTVEGTEDYPRLRNEFIDLAQAEITAAD